MRRDKEKRERRRKNMRGPKLQFKPTVPESGCGGTRQDYLVIVPKTS